MFRGANGVEQVSLAQELKPLSYLRSLHMGLYLTPHEAISAHLRDHCQGESDGVPPWDFFCKTCSECFKAQTQSAETAANVIMFDAMPQLQHMSWASFFTSDRLGAVSYTRQLEACASEQCCQGDC
jgi:hypothetical protein